MNSIAKKLVSQMYEDEQHSKYAEATLVKVTLQGNVEDIALLNAIAERFGQTRFSISRELLQNVMLDMFLALTPEDQQALALKADAEITEHKKKVGFTQFFETNAAGTFENESGYWRGFAAIAAKSAAKRLESEGGAQ